MRIGMTKEVSVTATVTNGRMTFNNRERFAREVQGLEAGVYRVQVSPLRASRSQQQNRYYWHIMRIISQETGQSEMSIHTYAKHRWLARPMVFSGKEGVTETAMVAPSSASLPVDGFYLFTENVRQWASEFLGIDTPPPNEFGG